MITFGQWWVLRPGQLGMLALLQLALLLLVLLLLALLLLALLLLPLKHL
jgi:hypothetical protein